MAVRAKASSHGTALKRPKALCGGAGGVAAIQRGRLIAAMTEIAAEHGLANAAIAQVVARAGVSRRTAYELFEGREACFLAALDEAIGRVSERVVAAYDPSARWRVRVRSGLIALLSFIQEDPSAGRLIVVASLGAGPVALERRNRMLAAAVALIEEGAEEVKGGVELPSLTAEGVVGGALSVLHDRLVKGDTRSPLELTNSLMSMIVLPYLGASTAKRELDEPIPVYVATGKTRADPLRGLQMRLTLRTITVLRAIGSQPGASNRQLGNAAGVVDQGQISKLLGRLERLGVIENTAVQPTRGSANAWTFTERGWAIHAAVAG
ncbi:MAG TPA: TetR/AcrR family transcriptional regulator [Solirubrobacteraceae bacterium]|jgi:AcrR family transcriptional regulator|nr:TetR/AcrR family transcriptional regulator [Solirubrobacteraceae bacterium]